MGISPEELRRLREEIGQVGRGEPVDGVYVLMHNGVVHRDHNGQSVAPDDPFWNSDEAVLERRRVEREKAGS